MTEKLKQILSGEQLVIEADGSLFVIPHSCIKYLQAYPAPSALSENVISGATLKADP